MEIELLDHVRNKFALCKIDGDKYTFKIKGYDASSAVSQGVLVQKYRSKELGYLCSELDRLMREVDRTPIPETPAASVDEGEHTGKSVSYYDVTITQWTNPEHQQAVPVTVSCNDIIEALGMNYAQANVFKAQWRIAAAKQGKTKQGNNTFYDAEKSCFFSERVLAQETIKSQR